MMMGRMMSGWESYDSLPDYMKQMMQGYYQGYSPFVSYAGFLHFVTWLLVAALLIAAIRYLWNKGGKK